MDQKWGLLAPNPLAGDIYPTVLLRKPLDPILLFAFHFSLFTIHSFSRPRPHDIWTEQAAESDVMPVRRLFYQSMRAAHTATPHFSLLSPHYL